MSGKTARRLRKEKANRLASGKHDNLQTKALGAAAATMLAISIAPTIAQAETSSPAVSTDSATVAVAATATPAASTTATPSAGQLRLRPNPALRPPQLRRAPRPRR